MKTCFIALTLLVLFSSARLLAQDSASLTGTVTDASGAVLAGAKVTISSIERGLDRTVATNTGGEYLFPSLPIGSYDLSVTAPGFKSYKAKNVVLRVAQKARVDVALTVGGAVEQVTVEGSWVAQVETQSSDLSGVVTGKEITQLELNGRNFTQLATLVPGVSNQSGQDEGKVGIYGNVAFSMNGGRTEYNNWELDGGDNMDNGSNTSLNVYPSIDAIAEFRVLTSNYGAQYGRNGSGTVEVETKSGTRAFHGDAYEFVRNDMFNARNYFESTVPSYKKNDFGYTVGGPVYIPGIYNTNKQKTFFFWSQEWRRERVPTVFNSLVPSAEERTGNFNDLCPNPNTLSFADCPLQPAQINGVNNPTAGMPFLNNQVPVSPVGQALLALIPAANGGVPGAAVYNASPVEPTNWREELIRVDHNFTPNLRAMFHYAHDSWFTITPTTLFAGSAFPTSQTNFTGPTVSVLARISQTFSPTLLNEFTVSYTTDHIITSATGYPDPNAWQRPANFPMGSFFNNGFGGKLPTISLTGNNAYNNGFYQDPNGEWPQGNYNSNPTYTYRDNVTKMIGSHNLQIGAYFVAAQKNELSGLFINGSLGFDISSSVSTGNSFADLLMGQVASYSQGSNEVKFYNRYKILEPYVQDDWHVSQKLTLNLGLRVSLFGTYRERYQHAYNWDPAAYNPANAPQIDVTGTITGIAGALVPGVGNMFDGLVQCGVNGVPAGCSKGHLFNPAPRIGFAWDPKNDGRMAIRGGYGIFFEHTNGNEANTEGMEGQSSPLLQSPTEYNISGYPNLGNAGGAPVNFPLTFYSIPGKAVWPYMQQWHLDIQREVAKGTVATVSYVGSKGTHLGRVRDINQIYPVPSALNPYKPGEPIGGMIDPSTGLPSHDDCGTQTTPSGVPITGQALTNLMVACGADPDPFRPFYGVGSVTRLENTASSTYHALQASLRKSVGALQINGSYTYSHSIDDASSRYDSGLTNSYDPAASRASSAFDIRHMINVGYVYDLPFFRGHGLSHTLLGGWQYSGIASWQTGTPFGVINGGFFPDNAGVGGASGVVAGSYADLIGNPRSGIPPASEAAQVGFAGLLYNPGAYAAPRGLTFGDSGRNSLRNPSRTNFDMALFKHFAITESKAFEFRVEAFNIFNHTEFAPIAGDGGSATYNGGPSSGTNSMSCYGGPNNSAGDPGCVSGSPFLHLGAAHLSRILQLGAKFIF
ncbi:MAG: carboxypeptidase regulatory-like domain-containing protein [Acidobacteriales bacterium]|nr:carboxypeptidase regulatory-like domain-containing protein [Terriglobales bacterium]